MRIDRPRLPGPVHAMDWTKSIKRTAAHDQAAHQAGADEQIRIETHHPLRQSEILFPLTDQLMGNSDIASVNRKAAKRDMRTIGYRPNNLGNALYFVSHGAPFRLMGSLERAGAYQNWIGDSSANLSY